MFLRRLVSNADAQRTPYIVWNAFIDLLACSEYEELNDVQRAPHVVFWYESEVQNGGHLQFFENHPADRIEPTISALQTLDALAYMPILKEAARRWGSPEREKLETAEEYFAVALEGAFNDLDLAFGHASPELVQLLQKYLDANLAEFVTFVE